MMTIGEMLGPPVFRDRLRGRTRHRSRRVSPLSPMQRGENEVSIKSAATGHAEASSAHEERARPIIARDGTAAIPRHPDKAAALAAYRELLRGAELPDDLVEAATAGDLDAARASILDFIAAASSEGGLGRWAETERHNILARWGLMQNFPDELVREYGVPFLEGAIRDRKKREATAAEAARRAKGVPLGEIELSGDTICRLVDRNFLPAGTDRTDRAALTAAALWGVEAALDRLPPPASIDIGSSSPRAASLRRSERLAALRQVLLRDDDLPPELAAALGNVARSEAGKAAQLKRGVTISPTLPAKMIDRLVDRQFLANEDREEPRAQRAAFSRALAIGLDPPRPAAVRMTPVEISLAIIASDAFRRRAK
jgi:hypothetical protein